MPGDGLPEIFPKAEFLSVDADISTSYPLIDVGKNNFSVKNEETQNNPNSIEWGGNQITLVYILFIF